MKINLKQKIQQNINTKIIKIIKKNQQNIKKKIQNESYKKVEKKQI